MPGTMPEVWEVGTDSQRRKQIYVDQDLGQGQLVGTSGVRRTLLQNPSASHC